MADSIILGVNKSHNASATLLVNNEIVYHIESERFCHVKHDPFPFLAMLKIRDYVDHIDAIGIAGLSATQEKFDNYRSVDAYSAFVMGLHRTFTEHGFDIADLGSNHHQMHAFSAFYNSGFDSALCIVKDGMGSQIFFDEQEKRFGGLSGNENGSAFVVSYPHNMHLVEKHINVRHNTPKVYLDDRTYVTNSFSEGAAFETVSHALGFSVYDAGKVMGLASYGKPNADIPSIYKDGMINTELFKYSTESKTLFLNYDIPKDFQGRADLAYALQTATQSDVARQIVDLLSRTGEKNLCLSGGFFLNCVANYEFLNHLPDDVNIYVEPISSDAGTSIGAAKFLYYYNTKSFEKNPQKNIYYGPKYSYSLEDLVGHKYKEATPSYVAELIAKRNIVALYQGGSEAGPRALGNRSILYDPTDPNGKDKVNTVKKREWFRPFAGSVLHEHMNDWFDMRSLSESKYMMYAVDVRKDKRDIIPAITHVDGTCRVQTVKQEDNPVFYEIIKEFYKLTSVPVVFNTSFNLAGDTICETLDDSLKTLYNSEIDYLYLPELGVIVEKEKHDC